MSSLPVGDVVVVPFLKIDWCVQALASETKVMVPTSSSFTVSFRTSLLIVGNVVFRPRPILWMYGCPSEELLSLQ